MTRFEPSEIWLTEPASDLWMARRVLQRAAKACPCPVRVLPSYSDAVIAAKGLSRERQKRVLIVADRPEQWLRPERFPGLRDRANTFVVTTGKGCSYDCSYCYLQVRHDIACLTVYADVDDLARELAGAADAGALTPGSLLNAAEDGEPFATEWLTGIAEWLADQALRVQCVVELRTKSSLASSLDVSVSGQVIQGFSISSLAAAAAFEPRADPVLDRLTAAGECQEKGFMIALKLEPIIPLQGWRKSYRELLECAREMLDPHQVDHFSIGTLRFRHSLRERICENHGTGGSRLFEVGSEEVAPGRFSYPEELRIAIYEFVTSQLSRCFPSVPAYLSLETHSLCSWLGMTSGRFGAPRETAAWGASWPRRVASSLAPANMEV